MIRSWVVEQLRQMEKHRDYFESGGVVLDAWKGEVYARIDIYKRLLVEGFHDCAPPQPPKRGDPLPMVAAYTPHTPPRNFFLTEEEGQHW